MVKKSKPALEVPVEFGGVSIGDGTARLGIKINRDHLDLETADESLCGRRLTGRVVMGNGDSSQKELIKDRLHTISSVFDVKRIGVSPGLIGCGLTFSLQEIDVKELSIFAKKTGRLIVDQIADLPESGDGDEGGDVSDENDSDENASGNGRAKSGDWRNVALDTMFTGQAGTSFREAGLSTLGQLSDYLHGGKALTDLPGVGKATADKIHGRLEKFWADHPEYGDDPATLEGVR